ncbi:MAG: 16S rRNA (cytosine(967)-C(5))-methyltransferase RsmB [Candidatus Obscuribacterales bacterium]|nr:16S rRNA (cytosine(967)-C(5))-methyltransferase RsmB [Candidatus Obscuribacterales bacterium]
MTEQVKPTQPKGSQSRRAALQVLMRVTQSGAYSNLALSQALEKSQLSKRDKAFVTLLVQGVTRNLGFVDDKISQFSKTPVEKLPPVLLNTLRLGIFQLEFLKDTPPSAVLNTSTAIAKELGHKGMASYTTAVLRSYLRARESQADSADEPPGISVEGREAGQLAKNYSLPLWLVERWLKNFAHSEVEALLRFSTSEPRIVLRANELGITADGLSMVLTNAGVEFDQSPLVESCFVLSSRGRGRGKPSELPGYNEGMFSIQDDTAALVAKVVDPKPGEVIIDLCAAPGGKALFLGELMDNKGRVIAVDTRSNRLDLLKENRRRLGITNIETFVEDGTKFFIEPQVDRILIDAPCSGTGVLNRRADLRHRRQPDDIASLAKLQYELLANAQRLLKPDGVLVYATCSVEPEENEQVVDEFLRHHPQYRLDDLTPFFPKKFVESHNLDEALKSGKIQILPSMDHLSGFFIARMRREHSDQQSSDTPSD